MPFSGSLPAMKMAQVKPSITSQKYSKELNFSATSASAGAATISTSTPKMPPSTREHQAGAQRQLGLAAAW